MKSDRRPRSFVLFSVIATLLVFFGGVALKPSDATIYSPNSLVPDLHQDCRSSCTRAHAAAMADIEAVYDAARAAIDAMRSAMLADARAELDAVLNNPNATNERKNRALAEYGDRIDEITGLWGDLLNALWDAKNAAFQLAYLAYQTCLAACELIPPFDLVINPFP
jgi:hypothetical protein